MFCGEDRALFGVYSLKGLLGLYRGEGYIGRRGFAWGRGFRDYRVKGLGFWS